MARIDGVELFRGSKRLSGGAAAAAAANARKAMGTVVHVEPAEFERIVAMADEPLLVVRKRAGGIFSPTHKYLVAWRGFVFYTTSRDELRLSGAPQYIDAKSISVPH